MRNDVPKMVPKHMVTKLLSLALVVCVIWRRCRCLRLHDLIESPNYTHTHTDISIYVLDCRGCAAVGGRTMILMWLGSLMPAESESECVCVYAVCVVCGM